MSWRKIPAESGRCPVFVYQMQLEHLYDQAVREKDQQTLIKLIDQILQLLAENQKDPGEITTPNVC
jgi:hypothetical protein